MIALRLSPHAKMTSRLGYQGFRLIPWATDNLARMAAASRRVRPTLRRDGRPHGLLVLAQGRSNLFACALLSVHPLPSFMEGNQAGRAWDVGGLGITLSTIVGKILLPSTSYGLLGSALLARSAGPKSPVIRIAHFQESPL